MLAVLELVRDQELAGQKCGGGACGRILGDAAARGKHARAEGRVLAVAAAGIDIGGIDIVRVLAEARGQGAPGRLAGPCLGENGVRRDGYEEEGRPSSEQDR